MNEKELLEIEQGLRSKIQEEWPTWEQIEQLIAEVRKLNEEVAKRTDKICDDHLSLEGKESEIIGLKQENKLYKDLYTKANTQNMVYKKTLKSILEQAQYDSSHFGRSTFIEIKKALEGDHQ